MPVAARVTGRITGKDESPCVGRAVQVFIGGSVAGKVQTDSEGTFQFTFTIDSRTSTLVSVEVLGKDDGSPLVRTRPTTLTQNHLDFQMKVGEPRIEKEGPDIYSDGLRRIVESYRGLEGRLDPDDEEAAAALNGLIGMIGEWESHRELLEEAGAAEVVQVPRHPRSTRHYHVTRWDEVTLPV